MPITLQQVLRQLDTDEPNYAALAALGPEAVPHLATLIRGEEPGIAAKAAYLASLIQSDDAMELLASAAASPHATVRVAAAAGLRNVTTMQAFPVADRLLEDSDPGVRKQALRSAGRLGLETLMPKMNTIASEDSEPELRQIAKSERKRIAEQRVAAKKEAEVVAKKPAKRTTRRRPRLKKK